MSFNIALSGVNAAQSDLDVTSNNIANVNTTGFKRSRAEFGDIFAVSALGNSDTAVGSGVILQRVAQQFTQGNLNFTENVFDLAVSGEGFFVFSPTIDSSESEFSRAGALGVNEDGFVVNGAGQFLQVFPVNQDGTVQSTSLASTGPVRLPDSAGSPQATSEVDIGVNLTSDNSTAPALDVDNFDPDEPTTFTSSTSVTIFDSQGQSHIATTFFVRDNSATNQYAVFLYVDDQPVNIADVAAGDTAPTTAGTSPTAGQSYATLSFDTNGNFTGQVPSTITSIALGSPAAGGGAGVFAPGPEPSQTLTLDFANNTPTQNAAPFAVNSLAQNGFTTGRLTGIDIDDSGLIRANFNNGQALSLGVVALARFSNSQGLQQLGNTSFAETIASGTAIAGVPG